jgi:hypothetical protein
MSEDIGKLLHGSSGLLEDVDVRLVNVRFETDRDNMDDQGRFRSMMVCDLVPSEDSGEETLTDKRFSIGKGWTVKDRGQSVVREDGKSIGFNRNTPAQKLLSSIIDECDGEGELVKRYKSTRHTPMQAAFWEGMGGHIESRSETGEFGGEKREFSWLIFTEFHGWDDEAKAAPKKRASKKAAVAVEEDEDGAEVEAEAEVETKPVRKRVSKKAAAKVEAADDELGFDAGDADPTLVKALVALAADHDSAEDFADAAYEMVEGLEDDDTAMELVDDGTIFEAVNG